MFYFSGADKDLLFNLIEKVVGTCQQGNYKKDFLIRNIEKRIIQLGINSFPHYLHYLNESPGELDEFISLVTIHTTHWFREFPHYMNLKKELVRRVQKKPALKIKVLSAGCSTGEEVYSLALLFHDIKMVYPNFCFEIIGVDVDPISIAKGKRGIYSIQDVDRIPKVFQTFIKRGTGRVEGHFTVLPEIREHCSFYVDSILELEEVKSIAFDIIFCRNILIYFSPEQIETIIRSFIMILRQDGVLTLGHSEAILTPEDYSLSSLWVSSYTHKFIPQKEELKIVPVTEKEGKYTVLVVDDSRTIRKQLDILFKSAGIHVLLAESAAEAEKILKKEHVDLVSLDLNMPGEQGGEFLLRMKDEKIELPPVIVITDVVAKSARHVLTLLENGAQDYLSKEMIFKERELIVERVLALIGPKVPLKVDQANEKIKKKFAPVCIPELIVIGASTGGTEVLSRLLKGLPNNLPPILIVQHITSAFALPFARRLSVISGLELGILEDGAVLEKGSLYLSPGDFHLGIKECNKEYVLDLFAGDPIYRHLPSVDYLFRSALPYANKVLAIILTGMGDDGADAITELRKNNSYTFAQDNESSVVFGMPMQAIKKGGIDFIGSPEEIRQQLDKIFKLK